jgi:hypothetical protein
MAEADPTPQLDPAELYDKRRAKDSSRLRAYNKILEQIYNRIRVLSRLPNSPCYLLYTVPPFILGLPKIDLEDCMVYLIYQLRHASYEVRYTPPNMIYISWNHHETAYIVGQSPIMAAMMESAEKTKAEEDRKAKEAERILIQRKSQRKVKIQTPMSNHPNPSHYNPHTTQSTQATQSRPFSTPMRSSLGKQPLRQSHQSPSAGPPLPSAAEYIPPTTFLDNVSNPANSPQKPTALPDYFRGF